jgi:hypothetical protein
VVIADVLTIYADDGIRFYAAFKECPEACIGGNKKTAPWTLANLIKIKLKRRPCCGNDGFPYWTYRRCRSG